MTGTRARIGLALTVIFWGGSFIAIKILLRELNPAVITAVRFAMGVAILAGVSAKRGQLRLPRLRQIPLLALLGFSGIALHQWLQATGLQTASASVTSWIVATIPVFVALLGWLVLHERMGVQRVAGIGLAALGVILVVAGGNPAALFAGRIGSIGDILIGLSAVNWALFTILSKRALDQGQAEGGAGVASRPGQLMLHVMGFGWLFSLIWMAAAGGWDRLASLSLAGWWAMLFLGVACSGLAYLFWYDALDVIDATQAGVFLYFGPLVTVALAWPLLGETITIGAAIGGLAILMGVWLVERA